MNHHKQISERADKLSGYFLKQSSSVCSLGVTAVLAALFALVVILIVL